MAALGLRGGPGGEIHPFLRSGRPAGQQDCQLRVSQARADGPGSEDAAGTSAAVESLPRPQTDVRIARRKDPWQQEAPPALKAERSADKNNAGGGSSSSG